MLRVILSGKIEGAHLTHVWSPHLHFLLFEQQNNLSVKGPWGKNCIHLQGTWLFLMRLIFQCRCPRSSVVCTWDPELSSHLLLSFQPLCPTRRQTKASASSSGTLTTTSSSPDPHTHSGHTGYAQNQGQCFPEYIYEGIRLFCPFYRGVIGAVVFLETQFNDLHRGNFLSAM